MRVNLIVGMLAFVIMAGCTTGPTAADIAAGSWVVSSNRSFMCDGTENEAAQDGFKGQVITLAADSDAAILSGGGFDGVRFQAWNEQVIEGQKNWYSEAMVADDGSRHGLLVAENGSGITWMFSIKRDGCAATSGEYVFLKRQ